LTQINADLEFCSDAATSANQQESFCHGLTQMNTDFLRMRQKEICVNQLEKSASKKFQSWTRSVFIYGNLWQKKIATRCVARLGARLRQCFAVFIQCAERGQARAYRSKN
jgi:hypothetical protein